MNCRGLASLKSGEAMINRALVHARRIYGCRSCGQLAGYASCQGSGREPLIVLSSIAAGLTSVVPRRRPTQLRPNALTASNQGVRKLASVMRIGRFPSGTPARSKHHDLSAFNSLQSITINGCDPRSNQRVIAACKGRHSTCIGPNASGRHLCNT